MIRIGSLANKYSWIAMSHYADEREQAKGILSVVEIFPEFPYAIEKMKNNVVIVVTFAAMVLESFFNNYAAQKLGEQFYTDNFEMLRPTSKLQMISKFFLKMNWIKEVIYFI